MELTMTRALIRRRNLKRKVSVLVLGTALISGTAFASAQVFVSGGWNTNYIERFNPTITKATAHDNAQINQRHYSWAKSEKVQQLLVIPYQLTRLHRRKLLGHGMLVIEVGLSNYNRELI